MKLPSGWYVVAASNEFGKKPLAVTRFGLDYVLWRDRDGKPVMMIDKCPHRSAKLSLGHLENGCIHCPFHGFQFDTTGSCTFVPETGQPATNLKVETTSLHEAKGLVWTYHGIGQQNSSPPWFQELDESLAFAQSVHEWPTHITRCVENQLDYAHLPYVHKTTIGAKVNVQGNRKIECENNLITMYVDERNPDRPGIKFIFPNLWLLTISPGRFYQFITFVPVSNECTRLYLRAYQGYVTSPLLSLFIKPVLNMSNSKILDQDRRAVLSQEPKLSIEAERERLYPSDRAISHFRRLWNDLTVIEA